VVPPTSEVGVQIMLNESTVETLKSMKLGAMASALQEQLSDSSTYSQLGFEERIGLLVDAEWNRRQSNKLNRFIRNANFSIPSATIEGIEYHEDRKLDKAEILRFATCKYIENHHHIILKGASGNGKTYISNAIGNAACRKFKSVRCIRMPELLDELNVAKGCGILKKTIKSYQKVDLLILDEWLIRPLTQQEAYDLLEIVESRCTKGSIIFCTQYETIEWYVRINAGSENGSPISEAIMDRIIHNSYEVMIDGRISMGERHGLRATQKGGNVND
jgi:DNA replication protein DnaC